MENFEFKPVKLRLKIDFVSYPAWAEGLVNRINFNYDLQTTWFGWLFCFTEYKPFSGHLTPN